MSSNFPNGFAQGVTIRGVPVDIPNPGQVFWVNNSTVLAEGAVGGSDGNDGSYRRPFSTLDYAVGKCKASRGDIIYLMPGHAETVSGAAFVTCDVAGITIIGLGKGALRPTFTFSATASTILVSAADVAFVNCRFVSSILNVVTGFSVSGNGFEMHNCECRDGSATLTFILFVTLDDGADRAKFIGNNFTGIGVTNDSFVSMAGTHDDIVIQDNYMAYSAIQTATVALVTSATACTNFICTGNSFATISAAGKWIGLTGTGNTGVVKYNDFLSDADQTAAEHKAGGDVTGCMFYENYFSSGVDFLALSSSTIGYTDEDVT